MVRSSGLYWDGSYVVGTINGGRAQVHNDILNQENLAADLALFYLV